MKRILILMLVFALCLPCVMAEEIGELGPAVVQAPADPNEIGELIVATPAPVANDGVIEDAVPAAPADNSIEDATPAANNEASIEDATPAAPAAPEASGETAVLQNVVLAVPAGWSVKNRTDDTATGGSISLYLTADDGSNQMMQAQSQSIGTQENIKSILDVMGAESFLSQTLVGTMQNFGVVVENYDYVMLKGDIPCVKTTEIISLTEGNGMVSTMEELGDCAMSIVVALDGTHMVVMMLIQEGVDAAAGAEMLNVVLSPMAQ